jgi:hypothetical protein
VLKVCSGTGQDCDGEMEREAGTRKKSTRQPLWGCLGRKLKKDMLEGEDRSQRAGHMKGIICVAC